MELHRTRKENKASPLTPLQGEGSNMFANYIVLKTPYPKPFTPPFLGEGQGERPCFPLYSLAEGVRFLLPYNHNTASFPSLNSRSRMLMLG